MTSASNAVSAARMRAIDALANDLANSYMSAADGGIDILVERLKEGFRGFANMSDTELAQALCDADLDARHSPDVTLLNTSAAENTSLPFRKCRDFMAAIRPW